jgi:hypothetical protein
MDYRLKEVRTTKHREFSRQSLGLGIVLIITLVAAASVDLDALLRYFRLISGSPTAVLEAGAIISLASAVPFLAMGMSIADDVRQNEHDGESRR